MGWKFLRNVLVKTIISFILFNAVLMALPAHGSAQQVSLYNSLVPGRARFPFGENPQEAYNFSLYDVNAMFASHQVSAAVQSDEVRIFVIGDSSVWGTLLHNDETLTGQLNAMHLTCHQKPLEFFNLGYPTISLTKDMMIMQRALQEQPDAFLWLTTLEAFPLDKQLASPLAANNRALIEPLIERYHLPLAFSTEKEMLWQRSLWGRRRELADWLRLQLYAFPFAATGVDQIYPEFTPAAWDLEAESNFYQFSPPQLPDEQMLYQALPAARDMLGDTPLLVVNEPIMISEGANSDIRYNFFYPRWAYDQYRQDLSATAQENTIPLVDAWDWIAAQQFTNSAIHMTPQGEGAFANRLAATIIDNLCREY